MGQNRMLRQVGASKKFAGHRDECRDGLLFPPERLLSCIRMQRISSGIFKLSSRQFAGATILRIAKLRGEAAIRHSEFEMFAAIRVCQ
jgi:hypothetical protein